MTIYLKIFATRRTNLKIFPSGCPQLPEIQNTKVDYEGILNFNQVVYTLSADNL